MASTSLICLTLIGTLAGAAPQAAPAEERPFYAPMSVPQIRAQLETWLAEQEGVDETLRDAFTPLWQFAEPSPGLTERFDALMQTFYLVDPATRALVEGCLAERGPQVVQDFAILESEGRSPFHTHNVRYFYARHLAVLTLYDESLEQFRQIDPQYLVDPAGCLFYRAVCEHALLLRDEGLATLNHLLKNTERVPVRYRSVAELMQYDLEELEEKSLGEVARQMRDVHRRLQLGSSGPPVQRVEEQIITTLDEIIKKIEQQQGGGGGGGGQGKPNSNQSSGPAEDSYIGGQEAPGEVDRTELSGRGKWGELPPKAQEKARNMINKQFPAHYRQAVEEYLKKLAERTAPTPGAR